MSIRKPSSVQVAAEQDARGCLAHAESLYRAALKEQPDNVEAMQGLAAVCHRQGRPDEALALFRRVIALDPDSRVADVQLGRLLERQGDNAGAAICYRRAVRLRPGDASAQADLGRSLAATGEAAQARICYRRAVALAPNEAWTHVALGNALLRQGLPAEALACYERATAIQPDLAEAHSNAGEALRVLGRLGEGLAACERALALAPDLAEAHNHLGNILREAGKPDAAVAHFEEALRLRPDWPEVYNNLAIARQDQGRITEAIELYERALKLHSGLGEVYQNMGNLGIALAQCGRVADALAALQRALALQPDYPEALIQVALLNGELCDWRQREEEQARVLSVTEHHPGIVPPFNLQAQQSTPADQLLCAQGWSRRMTQGQSAVFTHDRRGGKGRIRLGYLSADFRDHPVAWAITETVERHDRTQFEVLGYSYGPDDGSPLRRRLQAGFDRFIDLQEAGNEEASQQIYRDRVDVLIDLTGYTRLSRPRILASRPAPVQVNYLGFLGSMGAGFMDYIMADPFIAPSLESAAFTEKIVHLTGGWWPGEIAWEMPGDAPARGVYGLPEHGFVFCCFNTSYKIAPPIFDVWMRLLRATPASVLWLAACGAVIQENLRREASERGVSLERLVFAPREPMASYLARHRCADLFLDTLPYNGVGTAYHSLAAGLPVLTCAGETFAGRTAGSMLLAAGLPELVTCSLKEYEHLAMRLTQEAVLLADIRRTLASARPSAALFDRDRAVRELEAAYERMWENWQQGGLPIPFVVPSKS